MIRRETDANFLNSIANHPAVRPWVDYRGVDDPMDFTPACDRIAITGVVVLSNGEDAFACFEMTGEQEYQGHTFFGDSCRGRKAIETGKEIVSYMFDHGAQRLWGATPIGNVQARWFNRQIGFHSIGTDEFEVEGPVEIFEMRAH